MSSLKQLNHSIKLKRLAGKDNARQCVLTANQLMYSIHKQTQKHPFLSMVTVSISSFVFSKYSRKIRRFYPFVTLGRDYLK